jgi:hypothetical protein
MQAVILPAPGEVVVEDKPVPTPAPTRASSDLVEGQNHDRFAVAMTEQPMGAADTMMPKHDRVIEPG